MKRPRVLRTAGLTLAVVGVALFFAFLEAAGGRLMYPNVLAKDFWVEALFRTIPSWLILAALLPGIVFLARVARVRRETWRTALPIQVLAAVLFTLIYAGATALITADRNSAPFLYYFLPMFSRYGVINLFIYGAIVAVIHAWHFQAEAQERAVRASELEASLARAKLQFLRAQLHPHFLFNALNSISALALNGERERVASTVSSLSELLRRCLDESEDHETPLVIEMELVDHYLELERARFGDRLTVTVDIAPEAMSALVPSLLVQTLVENAVRHGIEGRRGPGRIAIEGTTEGGRLILEVRDTGPGFGSLAAASEGHGIGLENATARLEQLYGEEAILERGAAPEGGARVTVRLPHRRGRSQDVAGAGS